MEKIFVVSKWIIFVLFVLAIFFIGGSIINKITASTECTTGQQYIGRYFNRCPANTTIVAVNIWQISPTMSNVIVDCVKIKVICE